MALRGRIVEASVDRCWMAAEARFRTWSFISAAQQLAAEGNSEQAWRFMERADRALGLDDSLEVNHPVIAQDYGGDQGLWDVRRRIRVAKDQLKAGQLEEAQAAITRLDSFFFFHAFRRSIECISHLIDPDFGVA